MSKRPLAASYFFFGAAAGAGSAFPTSSATFHDPSAYFFQMVT